MRATTDVSEVAQCEIVFLCLPNGDVVREVVLGDASLSGPGSRVEAIVDTSTIAHARAVDLARELELRGIAFVDAPVTGMEARAVAGTLTAMCGGKRDAFERVQAAPRAHGEHDPVHGARRAAASSPSSSTSCCSTSTPPRLRRSCRCR